jgi:hypothetical protein
MNIDLSSDVDFSVLARLAKLSKSMDDGTFTSIATDELDPKPNSDVTIFGPVTQEHFLTELGIIHS